MKKFVPALAQLCLGSALISHCWAATFHVAVDNPSASDDSPASLEHPLKSIRKAAEIVHAGDIVIIHGGVYREQIIVKTHGSADQPILFQAAKGEHVVITGADRLTAWNKTVGPNPIYSTPWPHKFITWNPAMTHPNDEYHRLIGRCEQVMVNGYFLRQCLSADQLAPGSFYVDIANKTLFAWDAASRDLNKINVEASTRQELFRVESDHVQTSGITFRYAANMAQHGAVVLAGKFDVIEDCVFERMNSSGASFQNEDAIVRRCIFRDNGQLGFGASGAHRLLFTDCLVENNNTKDFDRGWEAGGDKLVLCRDALLQKSRFLRNRGNGIWFDIGNTNCTVRECLIAENEDAGIFYEISFALRARDNVIVRNGFARTPGAWGAQAGISLSSSPGCTVERNLILDNREGFNFREQVRTTPTIGDRKEHPVWNYDELIRNNIIAFNRDAQIWGWFDIHDNRHWPAATESRSDALALEKLNLRFENNIYFAAPGQGGFNWGPSWARHEFFHNLTDFEKALHIDKNSQALDPPFADLDQLDFRLPRATMKSINSQYPRGAVPGVILGIQ